jgi:hypothetical protein
MQHDNELELTGRADVADPYAFKELLEERRRQDAAREGSPLDRWARDVADRIVQTVQQQRTGEGVGAATQTGATQHVAVSLPTPGSQPGLGPRVSSVGPGFISADPGFQMERIRTEMAAISNEVAGLKRLVADSIEGWAKWVHTTLGDFASQQTVQITERVSQQLEVRITQHVTRAFSEVTTGMQVLRDEVDQRCRALVAAREEGIHRQTERIVDQRVETHRAAVSQLSGWVEQLDRRASQVAERVEVCERSLLTLESRVLETSASLVGRVDAVEGQVREVVWSQRERPALDTAALTADVPLPQKESTTGRSQKATKK